MYSLLLLASLALPQDPAPQSILFLGNSYTGVNDLPTLVKGFANAAGHTPFIRANTPGGYTLGSSPQAHATNATSLGLISLMDWDVVVLQEQSYLPTIPFTKTNFMFPGAASLDAAIKANDPTTQTVLYQTWGRRFGGQFCYGSANCSPDFADFDAMQDSLTASYAELGALIGADVIPVGEAWRSSLADNPALVLHAGDNSHPNMKGSYLAAAVFFGELFDQSPVGNTFSVGLSPTNAAYLQDVAAHMVWDATCGTEAYTAGAVNPLALTATGSAALGGSLTFDLQNQAIGTTGQWFGASFGESAGSLFGQTLLIDPTQLIVPLVAMGPGTSWVVGIPTEPAFTGLDVFVQGLAASPSGIELSNGVRVEICP
ncbi:MAG: hypothetical protein ACJAZ8_001748 [Planctomycetota bacterium]|jgi:hypothetical protein